MKNYHTIIQEGGQGRRLDKFLAQELIDTTRSQIKKTILDGLVLINDKKATVHQFLKVGDAIKISEKSSLPTKKIKKILPSTTNKKIFEKIKIITDEPDFLIIEKPSGLLVHPTPKVETNTLVDWLLEKYPELRNIGEDPQRPAIVHRLDKDVSGLMLIPKSQKSFDYFKRLFKLRNITKKYTALVYGEIWKDEDEITFPISRSVNKKGLFAAKPKIENAEDKPAHTIFNVIQKFKNYTLLEVQILTGRTHQIRVHLLAYGNPIVGDPIYKNKRAKLAEAERIFLHASYLSFIDLGGKKWEFKTEIPKPMTEFIKKLKVK
jgi:23S rRNA pseudouridine1911/1915/1917 synthase